MKVKTWSEQVMKKVKPLRPIRFSKTTLKAHWIDISDATTDNGGDWHRRDLKCSNCKIAWTTYYEPWYCPHCGARMIRKESKWS